MDVNIYANTFIPTPRGTHAQVRHLRSNSRQGRHASNGIWNITLELVQKHLRRRLQILRLVIMKPHLPDKPIQHLRLHFQDARNAQPALQLGLQRPHRRRSHGILCLTRQHQRHERLEPLVHRARPPVRQRLAPHRVDGREHLRPHRRC